MLFGFRRSRRQQSEGERPFWISYADLMTAMMMLCLVAMAVTILAISQELKHELSAEEVRAKEILEICTSIKNDMSSRSDVNVDCQNDRIDFGEAGRFEYKDYHLKAGTEDALSHLVPAVLTAANGSLGQKWLKQVVIEGYTDTQGSYLYNLYLSLQRSYWLMCALTDPQRNAGLGLTADQVRQVRELFLAGGVSYNDPKASAEASRRVELRLQFYSRREQEERDTETRPAIEASPQDRCQLT